MSAAHAGAELTNKKQKKWKQVSDKKASRSKTATGPDGAEAKMGDVMAPIADGPSTEAVVEHFERSVPAKPNEPSPYAAALGSLAAGAAAARGAEADVLLSSKQAAKKSQSAASRADPVADFDSVYMTISNVDKAKLQTQGYMSSNSIRDKCPLDCDKLVFPVPLGKQWACAVVDMRERSITYGRSFKVLVGQTNTLCLIISCCDYQLAKQHDVYSLVHTLVGKHLSLEASRLVIQISWRLCTLSIFSMSLCCRTSEMMKLLFLGLSRPSLSNNGKNGLQLTYLFLSGGMFANLAGLQ